MTGFVEADLHTLTEEQRLRYRGAYCGLCRALYARWGNVGRLTLSYDMTFLVLLLSSMYEPEETAGKGRCLMHPVRQRSWWQSRFFDYAADLSVVLAYFNLLDDWDDEKKLLSLGGAKLLEHAYESVRSLRPEQCSTVENALAELRGIERNREPDPDAAANCFGRMMGVLFTPEPDAVWGERLAAFGEKLGRFVYFMDACVDLERDRRSGSYNPLLAMHGGGMSEEEKLTALKMLMGECTAEFERLPLVQDTDILRSVLYSGVWRRYARNQKKQRKEKRDADDQ